MKDKRTKTVVLVLLPVLLAFAMMWCTAKYVFLSPSCYSDNNNLTQEENYYIKKLVLEAIENRLSIFADENIGLEDTEEQGNRKHFFVLINGDFMNSATKNNDGYAVAVQTYFMEPISEDCLYEIHLSTDFNVVSFELDP